MPGGQCHSAAELDQPGGQCTYHVEKAGEVTLDELSGIEDYLKWWSVDHNREYVWQDDKGVGTDFWDGRDDPKKCSERMRKIQALFGKKYPDMPVTYGEPPCDGRAHQTTTSG